MEQKLVVHRKDGKIYKGVTQDFDPSAETFHFLPAEGGGVPMLMRLEEMKALFWVKDFLGNRHFEARRSFETADAATHRAIVVFEDGEQIWGTVESAPGDDLGFFLTPVDRRDNNIRIFVIRSALKEMREVS
jgi:hypothetical protein